MAQVDTDKDGFLSTDELKQTPGLQSCAKELDTDGDNRLSRDEVLARFKLYQDTGAGLVGLNCRVLVNGQPAQDAEVQLVPEDFLKDYVPTASRRASDGSVSIISPNPEGLPLAREGMYRVEITSPSLRIPAKYNTETSFGIEVLASSYATQGREFKVTTR
jgi:hypothetical protein